jgi:hypothetical protein
LIVSIRDLIMKGEELFTQYILISSSSKSVAQILVKLLT